MARKRQRLHQPSYHSLSRPRLTDGQRRALRGAVLQDYLEPTSAAACVGVRLSDIDDDLMAQLKKDFAQATSFMRANLIRNIDPSDSDDWRILDRQLQIRDRIQDKWDNTNGSGPPIHRITIEYVDGDGDVEDYDSFQPEPSRSSYQRPRLDVEDTDELPDFDDATETEVERACRLRGHWFPGDDA